MVKENTESKSESSISKEILKLEHNEGEKRRKRNKRILILNGGLALFLIVLGVLPGILTGKWGATVPNLIGILWLGFVTILELENSNLRWIMGMQSGLRELERAEIDTLMADLTKNLPTVPKAKKGKK